jgi:oligopeptidase B
MKRLSADSFIKPGWTSIQRVLVCISLTAFGCTAVNRTPALTDESLTQLHNPEEPRTRALVSSLFKDSSRYEASLSGTLPAIKKELLETRTGLPVAPLSIGGFHYQLTYPKGQKHPILIRSRVGSRTALPEAVLNFNILFAQIPEASLSRLRINSAQSLIAVIAQIGVGAEPALFVQRVGDLAPNIAPIRKPLDMEWLTNTDLVFIREDENEASHLGIVEYFGATLKVLEKQIELPGKHYEHTVRKPAGYDSILLRQENFRESSEHVISRNEDQVEMVSPMAFTSNFHYRLFPKGDAFFVLTNQECQSFCLKYSAPSGDVFPFYTPPSGASILSIETYEEYLVVFEQREGIRGFVVLTYKGDQIAEEFPGSAMTAYTPAFSDGYGANTFQFYEQSYLKFRQRHQYNVDEQKIHPAQGQSLAPPVSLHGTLLQAPARDGERIPISFICEKNIAFNKSNPSILIAYGAYGKTLEPDYPSLFAPLLKRKFCIAQIHVRGGGFLGPLWHKAATGSAKMKSINDFVDAGEYLQKNGFAQSGTLAAYGRSAGAVTVASAVLQKPDLFTAVALEAPFLDVANIAQAKDGLSLRDRDEWGDATDAKVLSTIRSYNPMDRIQPLPYPALFISAGLADTIVPYWHGLLWGYKMKRATTSGRAVLVRIHQSANHGGLNTAYDQLQEEGLLLGFLLRESKATE